MVLVEKNTTVVTKLGFIDTHNHLCDSAFLDDVDEVVHRAMASGVQAAIVLTETIPDISRALELREKYPDWVNLGFGIHPIQKRNDGSNLPRSVVAKVSSYARSKKETYSMISPQDMDGFRELLQKYSDLLVAVGEVGLDFTPSICATPDSHEIQRHVLSTQIRLANRFNLPLNVHSRSASKPTIELLRSEGATRVQMHAFDGRPSQALIGVSAGYYFSVPPCVLRSKQKQELVKAVPLTNLLLETDAPVLGVSAEVSCLYHPITFYSKYTYKTNTFYAFEKVTLIGF
ncbi:putative deoxyribonuclease TATDN3 isoform 2 [Fasciola gigantica]|uniref:Putative deoxyribonuclease TATDN3 isoform 2 n=1 Tax=Fasciola gigantica TaxID=46835 RepID=A0A504Z5S5_FASGI|nr:putative deoxyribonuclease TATDN3 isoform 2 [Fasciola gigantica]